MRKGIILQSRDVGLLSDCYECGVMSFAQVRKRHFPSAAMPTIRNRLAQLKRAGLIRVTRVGMQLHHGNENQIGVVYQITRTGIEALKSRCSNEDFRDQPLRLNTMTLIHDLLLNDVVEALGKIYHGKVIQIGKHLNQMSESGKRQPDAVIFDSEGKPAVAVELELTAKSERRYREIILQYRLSSDYRKVLYVVANHTTAEKIATQITGVKSPNPILKLSTEKFYFVNLAELLRMENATKMTNGEHELVL